MKTVFGKGKFQRQTGSNPGHLFTTGQVYSSLLVCQLGLKPPTLRALSHRTWHRWMLNTEYWSDQFTFFKVRSKWSFICHFPLVLGVFSCMGLELNCSSAGLTRRGGHISLPPSMEIWVSCLCNLPAAPWTTMWYLTSYRQAVQVRVGRRQGMASANSNATSSELIQPWVRTLRQEGVFLGNEWWRSCWLIHQQQERILIYLLGPEKTGLKISLFVGWAKALSTSSWVNWQKLKR